jgi:hypothetical protein
MDDDAEKSGRLEVKLGCCMAGICIWDRVVCSGEVGITV